MKEQLQYHLYKRFQVLEKVGEGTYGVVFKVLDKKTNQLRALKKIFDAFQNKIDSQRTYRQVLYLSELKHPRIVKLIDVIPAKNQQDLYILFQFIDYDIQKVVKVCSMAPIQRKFAVQQLLQALNYMHKQSIVHRDVKPSNILIDNDCNVKLCDFGLTRNISSTTTAPLTSYIAARSYRPPQVVLNNGKYGTAVDIWGVGCILGQMILKCPVFVVDNSVSLLDKIVQLVQLPKKIDIVKYYSQEVQQKLLKIKRNKKVSFYEKFTTATDQQIQFLQCLLQFVPEKRITAQLALKHRYFTQLKPLQQKAMSSTTVRQQCFEESSCRRAVQQISNRFRESQKSLISLYEAPFTQKYMDLSHSKISFLQHTQKTKIPQAPKKLNKSKSTITVDRNRSKISDSRKSSKSKQKSKSRTKKGVGSSNHLKLQKSKQRSKVSIIKKKSKIQLDKKGFYSQKILKQHLLDFLRK